jgi:tRNA modification GTPase
LQAEAVDDIVRAASLVQAEPALRLLRGGLSRKAGDIRDAVISLLADIEAGIEFPDENLRIPARRIRRGLEGLLAGVEKLCASYEAGKALGEGVTLAIVGRTNVGKSTLFNALLGRPRAIVHPKAGTTRDFLRETMSVGGALFHLIDMAGLGRPASAVETEGMRRGRQAAEEADGILFVFDSSARETRKDLALAGAWKGKKAVLVFNKSDLPPRIGEADVRSRRAGDPALRISARSGAGIPDLRRLLRKHFAPVVRGSGEILLHARHRAEMENARQALRQARRFLGEGLPLELLAEELRQALPPMARLTGEVRSNDVLEAVFARFCVGK